MIDPNSLMRNNLVQGISKHNGISLPNGIEYKIVGLMPFTCYVVRPDENPATVEKWAEFHYSLLDPIKLTPSILERCAEFECEYKSNFHTVYYSEKFKLSYYFWHSEDKNNQYLQIGSLQVPCEYLHQLMNITKTLTGKELEIKL